MCWMKPPKEMKNLVIKLRRFQKGIGGKNRFFRGEGEASTPFKVVQQQLQG